MSDAWLDALGPDPWAAAGRWLADAREAGLHEPDGAALATATPDGRPSVRMVLVRGIPERDLRFYTNHESRKAAELAENGEAALCFYWGPPLRRQVRVEGRAERLTEGESRAYFVTRARESRLGAWASPQSRPLGGRDELERRYSEADRRFPGSDDITLPEWWGGYRLVPRAFELWQNRRNRLHDRARFETAGGGWSRVRLAP
ncbi:MAG TPA: pyridoxamine 5'-phosphate oxidase [Gaiella sp.]|nr:pyridoxamine 5'-phosphate oxidase [Gaiella sp.]